MPPVAAVIGAIATFVANTFAAIGLVSFGAFAGNLILALGPALLQVGASMLVSKLFSPKRPSAAQRQALTLELSLGEGPREYVFGRAATGGSLANAWNDGGENEFESVVIILADHECDAIEGFFKDDTYYTLTTQGAQTHADFQDSGAKLWVEWRLGTPAQTLPSIISTQGVAAGEYEATDKFAGLTYIVLRYQISDKVWKSGRPRWRFVMRGHKGYNPAKDSTVAGGSGAHRWGQPSTYEWSRNARVNHYNFVRGIWNYAADPPQLMVGPGKSAQEAVPEEAIADIALCAESVTLKAGGTEARYCADGVIRSDEEWIQAEDEFAAAMGGEIVERGGTIGIDPGAAKTSAFTITDDDLISGAELVYKAKVPRDEMINTVVARFVDRSQLYEVSSAPMRRSQADIDTDGEPREVTIELGFVTSQTQAQRIAEITRRKGRLTLTAAFSLGPKYMLCEHGDWGTWTSQRRFAGDSRTVYAVGVAHDGSGLTRIAARQVSADCYAWNPAVDELDLEAPAYLPPGAPSAASVINFEAEPLEITSEDGISAGAIRATWDIPSDVTIQQIRLEYRPVGGLASSFAYGVPSEGSKVIDVLPVVDVDYEIRATPICVPRRDVLTTAWRTVPLSTPFTAPQPPTNFALYQNEDTIRFTWVPYADPTLEYEIRCGETFDFGRFVWSGSGGAASVVWPIASSDDDTLFWIKTRHRSGLYSTEAALAIATPNDLTGRNFVLAKDYQALGFPGVRHAFSTSTIGDLTVLELAQDVDAGVTQTRGDYYTSIELLDVFSARAWLEYRASAYTDDLPSWDETEDTWDDPLGDEDWQPSLGDPGGDATLDAYIALSLTALPDALVEGWRFNGTLEGARGAVPDVSSSTSYAPAKTADGVVVDGSLEYDLVPITSLSKLLDYRLIGAAPTEDVTLVELSNGSGGFLRVRYDAYDGTWVLEGHYGLPIVLALPWTDDDTVSIGFWQTETARGMTIASRLNTTARTDSAVLD